MQTTAFNIAFDYEFLFATEQAYQADETRLKWSSGDSF